MAHGGALRRRLSGDRPVEGTTEVKGGLGRSWEWGGEVDTKNRTMADRGLGISCVSGGLAELRWRGSDPAVETAMPVKKS